MKRTFFAAASVILLCIFFALFAFSRTRTAEVPEYAFTRKAALGESEFLLATVDTPESRQKGLSGHRPLKEHEGLLFEFDTDGYYGIWMKDMLFPIDVLWLDEHYKVVHIKSDFSPESFPEVAQPLAPARFVLEASSGTIERAKIKIGDILEIENEAENSGLQ